MAGCIKQMLFICLILLDAFVLPVDNEDSLAKIISGAIFPNQRVHRRTRVTPLKPDIDNLERPYVSRDRKFEKPCVKRDPCRNGGTCMENSRAVLKYRCICPLGYTGRFCKSKLPQCENGPCKDRGQCIATPDGFVCICKVGYLGRMCEYRPGASFLSDKDIRFVIKRDVFEITEIVLLCLGILIAITIVVLAIHCHRVNVVRNRIREVLQEKIEQGEKITSLPPSLFEVSNKLFHDVVFCKTDITWEELLGINAGSVTQFVPDHRSNRAPKFGIDLPKKDLWKKHMNILQTHMRKERPQSQTHNFIPKSNQNLHIRGGETDGSDFS